MAEIIIPYAPTPKQRIFHASTADEVLFGGAAGGGKSKAIVMDALFRCLQWPRTHAYLFRRTYGELEDTLIREARESYPRALYRYSGEKHEMALPNGSVIHFRHCAHLKDRFNYKGVEMQWLYFDELTSFEEPIYDFLKTRLRAKKTLGVRPCVRSSSNPGDIGHAWVKKRFVDAAPYMQVFTRDVTSSMGLGTRTYRMQYIPALATENPHIGAEYVFELEAKPAALRRALLNGDWNAFEGQVFSEWTDDPAHYLDRRFTHVIEPFDIPLHWPRYMSFDHGYAKPFSVGWWAVAPGGAVYRYREWYGCQPGTPNEGLRLTPAQIAQGIVSLESALETPNNLHVRRVADPAIFDCSRGESVARQMEPQAGKAGVYFVPGDNTRLAGKMQLHERLRFDENGHPKLYVFRTCRDFIRTVPALPYSTERPEDVDTAAEDHAYDEARYFFMAHPLPAAQPPPKRRAAFDPFTQFTESR